MSETFLTAETEEIRETTNFSVMALFGFFLALAGLFSIQYVQMMPVAIVGAVLGAATLVFSKRFKLGFISKSLGFLAVVIGSTTVSFGHFYRTIETNYELTQARRIAENYLENLSKDELDKVFFLVGFPVELNDEQGGSDTPTKNAMNRLREDSAHIEIRGRKKAAKWVFTGLESEYSNGSGHTYKLNYKDDGQSVTPNYVLFVRKNCPKYERSKSTVNWYVDKLEASTKLP